MNPSPVQRANTDEEIEACFDVLSQLRPNLHRHELVPAVRRMEKEGYRLASISDGGRVQAIVGYRIIEMLRTGKMLEIDDLITAEGTRSRGFGRLLHAWTLEEARANGCSVVELDSATHRADAHRFYFREKMHILAFHFSMKVER